MASRDPVRSSVSVTFLCYTNHDTRGLNDQYIWAWFRLENRTPFMLACKQGVLDVERAGVWSEETNRVGHAYDPMIEPGRTLTVSMMPPSECTRWRSNFLLTKMAMHSPQYLTWRFRFESFMDRLRLHRFGIHAEPWKSKTSEPVVVTSKAINL